MSNSLVCRDVLDFLGDYLDGTLPAMTRAEFEKHLDACPPCANYLSAYAETVRLSRSLAEERRESEGEMGDAASMPAVPEELVRAIMKARGGGGNLPAS